MRAHYRHEPKRAIELSARRDALPSSKLFLTATSAFAGVRHHIVSCPRCTDVWSSNMPNTSTSSTVLVARRQSGSIDREAKKEKRNRQQTFADIIEH